MLPQRLVAGAAGAAVGKRAARLRQVREGPLAFEGVGRERGVHRRRTPGQREGGDRERDHAAGSRPVQAPVEHR